MYALIPCITGQKPRDQIKKLDFYFEFFHPEKISYFFFFFFFEKGEARAGEEVRKYHASKTSHVYLPTKGFSTKPGTIKKREGVFIRNRGNQIYGPRFRWSIGTRWIPTVKGRCGRQTCLSHNLRSKDLVEDCICTHIYRDPKMVRSTSLSRLQCPDRAHTTICDI